MASKNLRGLLSAWLKTLQWWKGGVCSAPTTGYRQQRLQVLSALASVWRPTCGWEEQTSSWKDAQTHRINALCTLNVTGKPPHGIGTPSSERGNAGMLLFLLTSLLFHTVQLHKHREKENVIAIKENVMVNQWQPSVHQGERSRIKQFHLDQRASALMNQLSQVIKRWSLNTTHRWQMETVRSKRRKKKSRNSSSFHGATDNLETLVGNNLRGGRGGEGALRAKWPLDECILFVTGNTGRGWPKLAVIALQIRTKTMRHREDSHFSSLWPLERLREQNESFHEQNLDTIFWFFFLRLPMKWNPLYHLRNRFRAPFLADTAADQAAIIDLLKVSRSQPQLSDTFLSTEQLLWQQSGRVASLFNEGQSTPAVMGWLKPGKVQNRPRPCREAEPLQCFLVICRSISQLTFLPLMMLILSPRQWKSPLKWSPWMRLISLRSNGAFSGGGGRWRCTCRHTPRKHQES